MNMPRHIRVKPNQVATLALVVLQIVAGARIIVSPRTRGAFFET
jgi:hypothetical protein